MIVYKFQTVRKMLFVIQLLNCHKQNELLTTMVSEHIVVSERNKRGDTTRLSTNIVSENGFYLKFVSKIKKVI